MSFSKINRLGLVKNSLFALSTSFWTLIFQKCSSTDLVWDLKQGDLLSKITGSLSYEYVFWFVFVFFFKEKIVATERRDAPYMIHNPSEPTEISINNNSKLISFSKTIWLVVP